MLLTWIWVCYPQLPWQEHRPLRLPSGRHPVFTKKPLQPGLMHFKHTHTRGRWLSCPFSSSALSLVICGLLNGASSRDETCFIRSGSPELGARMKPLVIYSCTAVAFYLAGLCHFLLRGRPDALSADILRRGRHPHLAALYLFEGSFVLWFGMLWRILKFKVKPQDWLILKNEKKKNLYWLSCRGLLWGGGKDCLSVAFP